MFYFYVVFYLILYLLGIVIAYRLTQDQNRKAGFIYVNVFVKSMMLISLLVEPESRPPSGSTGFYVDDNMIFMLVLAGVIVFFNSIWLLSVFIAYLRKEKP